MREHLRPQTLPNAKSPWGTSEEEDRDRQTAMEADLAVLRTQLPDLLERFSRIKDPRRPGSVRHTIAVLLVYGVLMFVFNMGSRRKANAELSRPGLWEVLRLAFPELDSLPHTDTLARLLETIDPGEIEKVLFARMRALLRRQKLRSLMVERGYVIAVDGEQLWLRTTPFAPQATHRASGGEVHYAVYVVKAMLVCPEGVTLPLGAEFCENVEVDEQGEIAEDVKQDCELKATKRLCERVKEEFGRLPILLVADSLYASEPIVTLCRRNRWDFMVVLKEGKMPSLWREIEALHALDGEENTYQQIWHGREQTIWWVNDVEHEVRDPKARRQVVYHVVVCEERWDERQVELRADGTEEEKEVTKTARHAWISGKRLNAKNVHSRCNLAGRHRWDLEEANWTDKHVQNMTHAFSLTWQAIKGWFYLMLLGSLIQTLALYSVGLWRLAERVGVTAMVDFLWQTYSVFRPNRDRLRETLTRPAQLRLIW